MKIKINESEYKPNKPKAKPWRELMEFDETKSEIEFHEYVDAHVDIIAKSFANPAVTVDLLMDNLTVDEIMEIYRQLITWFCGLLSKKLDKIPNESVAVE